MLIGEQEGLGPRYWDLWVPVLQPGNHEYAGKNALTCLSYESSASSGLDPRLLTLIDVHHVRFFVWTAAALWLIAAIAAVPSESRLVLAFTRH